MKFLIIFVCLLVYVQGNDVLSRENIETLSHEHVQYINSLNTTWRAAQNFKGLSIKQLKGLCGTILDKDGGLPTSNSEFKSIQMRKLPEQFDSREQWPECSDVISHIRDQGSCGSCWAVSVASAITDRVCIATQGKNKTQLSAQVITSCCTNCFQKEGCQGGYPLNAWLYWVRQGLVTGGDYGDENTCAPYLIEPCEHHTEGPRKSCGDIEKTPKCQSKCTNEKINFEGDKRYGKMAFRSGRSVGEIKTELAKRGPMAAAFTVYDDFFLYKEGVYQVTEGAEEVGGHAIVVLGWGKTEDGIEYWLAKNNWNTDWGDKGYFKIRIGEADINEGFTSGIARVK